MKLLNQIKKKIGWDGPWVAPSFTIIYDLGFLINYFQLEAPRSL
jgi:hypothetical protein